MSAPRKYVKKMPPGKRRFSWKPKPMQMFLDLWQEYIRESHGTSTHAFIYREIANRMAKYGPTTAEVKTKVDNVKKKFRIELSRATKSKVPSSWAHFEQVEQIMKATNSYRECLDLDSDFDFSPMDDSDSSCDTKSCIKLDNALATEASKSPVEEKIIKAASPLTQTNEESVRNDSNRSTNLQEDISLTESDDIMAIEKAKLAIQRQQLKLMKNVADELSFLHREFLKTYRKRDY